MSDIKHVEYKILLVYTCVNSEILSYFIKNVWGVLVFLLVK